jgi:hypothetical protein
MILSQTFRFWGPDCSWRLDRLSRQLYAPRRRRFARSEGANDRRSCGGTLPRRNQDFAEGNIATTALADNSRGRTEEVLQGCSDRYYVGVVDLPVPVLTRDKDESSVNALVEQRLGLTGKLTLGENVN